MRTAIETYGLGKRYVLGLHTMGNLRETLTAAARRPLEAVKRRAGKPERDILWALRDVSLQINDGEAVGLIGHNGAGKSTLLRVMARTLKPNSGKVVVNGRASTLLQLGVGFNPELSGSRNIYLGGLAAGLRKRDIDAMYDDIVEYAEIDEAIHRPIKTYSSGMFSRLAFSVSMHLDPDILLLDEVLAVGDEQFRSKSMATMRDLLDRSGTIVFVSHAMGNVAEFCDRAMWLDHGRVVEIGPAEDVVNHYKDRVAARST